MSLQHMASERTAKIARFKAQKEMEKKVKVLKSYLYLSHNQRGLEVMELAI